MTIITISSEEHNNYFFTNDHCQRHGLDNTYVPCTYYLPMYVVPRESVPDGIVDTKEKLVAVFYKDKVEIPNPEIQQQ